MHLVVMFKYLLQVAAFTFLVFCTFFRFGTTSEAFGDDLVMSYNGTNVSTVAILQRLNITGNFRFGAFCPRDEHSCKKRCLQGAVGNQTERQKSSPCYCDSVCQDLGDCCYDFYSSCGQVQQSDDSRRGQWKCVNMNSTGSNGYVMKTKCPQGAVEPEIQNLCESVDNSDFLRDMPVVDEQEGVVYRNVFCARCNSVQSASYWRMAANCGRIPASALPQDNALLLAFIRENCTVNYKPTDAQQKYIKNCLAADDSCLSKQIIAKEPVLQELCSNYAFPVCGEAKRKNPHCALCNGDDITQINCGCSAVATSDPPTHVTTPEPTSLPHTTTPKSTTPPDTTTPEWPPPPYTITPGSKLPPHTSNPKTAPPQQTTAPKTKSPSHTTRTETAHPPYQTTPGVSPPPHSTSPGWTNPPGNTTPNSTNPPPTTTPKSKTPPRATTPGTALPQQTTTNGTPSPPQKTTPGNTDPPFSTTPGSPSPPQSTTPEWTTPPYSTTPGTTLPPDITTVVTIGSVTMTTPFTQKPPPPPPLNILFDFSSNKISIQSKTTQTKVLEQKTCQDGFVYDPFLKRCREAFHKVVLNTNSSINSTNSTRDAAITLNCFSVRLNSSDTVLYPNGTLWVPLYATEYNRSDYFINGSYVFLCTNFKNSKMETTAKWSYVVSPLHILTYAGSSVSILSLLILLVIYCIFKELRTLPGKNLMNLSLAMIFYHIFLFVAGFRNIQALCTGIAILLHYFMLCSFAWMSIMAFDVVKTFVFNDSNVRSKQTRNRRKTLLKYSVCAWGLPAIVVLLCVTLDLTDTVKIGYGLGGFCWIKNGTALLAVVGVPVALVLLFNFIALTWTVISIYKVRKVTNKLTDQGNHSSLALLYIKLTCVLGLTWVFGFLNSIIKTDATAYLFVAVNSLQGFFICLTFVAKKRTVALLRGPRKQHHESGHSNNTLDTKL